MLQAQAISRLTNLSQGLFDSSFGATSDITAGKATLLAEDANTFIDWVIDQTALWGIATTYRMTTPERRVSILDMSDKPLRPGQSLTDPGDTVHLSVGESILRPKLMRAGTTISDEEIDDNIEREGIRTTFLRLLTKKIGNQLETAALVGKEVTGDDPEDIEGLWNGWLTSAVSSGHFLDGSNMNDGVSGGDTPYITTRKLSSAAKAIPKKYFGDTASLRYITGRGVYFDFVELVGNRATPLGDAAYVVGSRQSGGSSMTALGQNRLQGATGLGWGDIELWRTALYPEDQFIVGTGSSTVAGGGVAAGVYGMTMAGHTGLAVGGAVKIAGDAGTTGEDEVRTILTLNTGTHAVTWAEPLLYPHASGNAVTFGTANGTSVLITPVTNLAIGIRRDITIEWWRRPDLGGWKCYVSMRADVKMPFPDAAVVVGNVQSYT